MKIIIRNINKFIKLTIMVEKSSHFSQSEIYRGSNPVT